MELNYLLQQAIMNIQNLQEYYEYQIKKTESYVNKEIKKYKYGVILEKYFINIILDNKEPLAKEEQHVIDEIIDTCDADVRKDGVYVKYKLKNIDKLGKKYEFNPRVATTEYIKLIEQPKILNDSTLIMLLVRYEEAISGILRYMISHYPDAYLKDKTITFSEIMAIPGGIETVKKIFLDKEIEGFMRLPLGDWYSTFESKHKAKFLFGKDEFERFKEIYYRRNIIVHNQKVVNDTYISNVKETCRKNVNKGDILQVDKEYMFTAFSIVKIIIYGTFWGLKKASKEKEIFEKYMFDMAFSHMLNKEWDISEYVYGIMKEDKEQEEASRICNLVNYWISVKNQNRLDEVQEEIEKFDVTAKSAQFKVAKYALLNKFDKVNEILEKVLGKDIPACYIEEWPLFIQYRDSMEYRNLKKTHSKEFEELGYEPDSITVENEEGILDKFENNIEQI
mgnify:CR=1 FL=1